LATLIVELLLVWLAWLPRPFRLACFTICTLLQVGIIATANYAFLNYLVFALGFLLLDDKVFARLLPRWPGFPSRERSGRCPAGGWRSQHLRRSGSSMPRSCRGSREEIRFLRRPPGPWSRFASPINTDSSPS